MADEDCSRERCQTSTLPVLSSLITENVDPGKMDENSSNSSVFADTECAEALLQLSKSSPTDGNTQARSTKRGSQQRQQETRTGAAHDECPEQNSTASANGLMNSISILKRQLEEPDVVVQSARPLTKYNPCIAIHLDYTSPEALRQELVKRVKLDHNYPCTSEIAFNRITYENQKAGLGHHQSLRDETAQSRDPSQKNSTGKPSLNGDESRGESKPLNSYSREQNGRRSSPEHKYHSRRSPGSSCSGKTKATNEKVQLDEYDFKDEEAGRLSPHHGMHSIQTSVMEAVAGGFVTTTELYQPNDSKYKNFNLLLKCLTTSDAVEDTPLKRERCDSNQSVISNNASGSSDDGIHIAELSGNVEDMEYQCESCKKVFLKKRYLTKHVRRMHPDIAVTEDAKEEAVACPSCGHSVLRKNFKRHSGACKSHVSKTKKQQDMDLASCQFCGLRMRRHILVKHLAQEHCIDSTPFDLQGMFLDENASESDSSTLSGSEHDNDFAEFTTNDRNPSPDQLLNSNTNDGTGSSRSEVLPCQASSHLPTTESPPMPPSLSQCTSSHTHTHKVLVSCQLCGVELSKVQLVKHLSDIHCVVPPRNGLGDEVSSTNDPARISSRCSHSMLHRFLSESGEESGGSLTSPNVECESCMQHLVAQAEPAVDNNSVSPVPQNAANTTYTILFAPDSNNASQQKIIELGGPGNALQSGTT